MEFPGEGRTGAKEAGNQATNQEGNEEALNDTSYPCHRSFSLFHASFTVSSFLEFRALAAKPGAWHLGGGASQKFHALAEKQAPSLPPPFGTILIKSFPKTGKGIRLTSGKAAASTCPSPHVCRREPKEGARDSLGSSADH